MLHKQKCRNETLNTRSDNLDASYPLFTTSDADELALMGLLCTEFDVRGTVAYLVGLFCRLRDSRLRRVRPGCSVEYVTRVTCSRNRHCSCGCNTNITMLLISTIQEKTPSLIVVYHHRKEYSPFRNHCLRCSHSWPAGRLCSDTVTGRCSCSCACHHRHARSQPTPRSCRPVT